jgi:hypothetical protein
MFPFYREHQIEKRSGKYICTVCKRTWTRKSAIYADCPDPALPVYTERRLIPPHLRSQYKLYHQGLRPGGPVHGGYMSPSNPYSGYALYDVNEAVPRPKATLSQLVNLQHPSVREYWRCYRCKTIFTYAQEQPLDGMCRSCYDFWSPVLRKTPRRP